MIQSVSSPADWEHSLLYITVSGTHSQFGIGPGKWRMVRGLYGTTVVLYDTTQGQGILAFDAMRGVPQWRLDREAWYISRFTGDKLLGFCMGNKSLLEPVLYGEMYAPLRDVQLFRRVRLDPEVKTLVWPNGADFDPYVLHEWPRVVDDLAQRLCAIEPA